MRNFFLVCICMLCNLYGYANHTTTFRAKSYLAAQDTCLPFSNLPCAALPVTLPYSISFSGSVANTLADKSGIGTGFTMALPYSGVRLSVDGTPAFPNIPGYQPSKISVTGGQLKLTTNKGIDYAANNNQINILGVQVIESGKLTIEVSLVNPLNGTLSQQAGIWFGINDHTSIKLVVRANKVEIHKEFNDISSATSGTSNTDQRLSPTIPNLNTMTVRLRLVIDSAANTAEGFYSTDGGNTYISTGVGYPTTGVKINGMGLTGVPAFAAIYGTYRSATTPAVYTFDDFSVQSVQQIIPNFLTFSADSLSFTVYKGGAVNAHSVSLITNKGTPPINFTAKGAPWITPPAGALGTVSITAANVSANLPGGTYKGYIVATAPGYLSDSVAIRLIIVDGINKNVTNINFSDPATVPPTNWVRDYGQPFGARTGLYQTVGTQYGWKRRSDGTPIDLTLNGFNRLVPEDITLATLIYMQANNISGTFPGTKVQSYWEMKVPNGTYDVTVSVGDGAVDNVTQSHNINVEGVKAIAGFVPSGKAGTIGRFKQTTMRVPVADELLTITADGGINTKINFCQVVPVSISPYLGWSGTSENVIIQKGSTAAKKFSLMIGNSGNQSIQYAFAATYGAGATGWLSFKSVQTGITPVLDYNYTTAASLPIGTYTATVKATKSGYSSTTTNIQLRVIDTLSPYVISSSPANGSQHVDLSTVSIAANNLHIPVVAGFKGGVDNSTITSNTVKLVKIVNGIETPVDGVVQGTGGGDAISFSPTSALEPNVTYKFTITNGVTSYSGAAFIPFSSTFVTDSAPVDSTNILNAQFTKVPITGTQGKSYTTVCFGPDGKFYALRLEGIIERYDVNHADGTLSNQQIITTLVDKYGERSAIGLVFDPLSTSTNLICYVTHSSSGLSGSPTFDGNISQLSGADLQNETLLITKLPRSTRDHMANSIKFGPDGALYLSQGSNSSAGAYDADWQRAESLLSGAILRIDMKKISQVNLPFNVQTTSSLSVINSAPSNSSIMSDGTYNPYSSDSPVTIYASGVRNAFDMVWHSNGQLYVPTNGSGGGGNSPASVTGTRRPDGSFYSGPSIPATTGVQVQLDWLFRVNPLKPVGFFGHPNPYRGQYVENRGFIDNPLYPANITADAAYRGYAYNYGLNHSPDGAIEYKSNTFNGVLKNKLLVCRFSGGGDIVVMEPGSLVKDASLTAADDDSKYDIVKVTTGSGNSGLIGMSGFANPLNLVEDTLTGNLYVIEYNWNLNPNLVSQITLLQVKSINSPLAAVLSLVADKQADEPGLVSYKKFEITLANRGDASLKIKTIKLIGADASLFDIEGIPLPEGAHPLILAKNRSLSFKVSTASSFTGEHKVTLQVSSVEDSVKTVVLTLNPGANASTVKDSVQIDFGKSLKDDIVVYPNPATGEQVSLQLKNFRGNEQVQVSVFDMLGARLKTFAVITDDAGNYQIPLTLPKVSSTHLYIIRAVAASGTRETKVMVH